MRTVAVRIQVMGPHLRWVAAISVAAGCRQEVGVYLATRGLGTAHPGSWPCCRLSVVKAKTVYLSAPTYYLWRSS